MSNTSNGAARCLDNHCVTCSDEGVPMRVESVADGLAVCVSEAGERGEVLSALVEPVSVGDVLLVHAGAALVKLPATQDGAS
jgi:hydrogenase maturation factor